MYGIQAITTNNGWAISVVGVSIVFTGLVVLSLIISQLHKAVYLFDHPEKIREFFAGKKPVPVEEKRLSLTPHQKETAKQFALLVRTQSDHFSLSRLLHLSQISGIKDPCTNLNVLLKSDIILPDGSGYFTWDQDRFDRAVSD